MGTIKDGNTGSWRDTLYVWDGIIAEVGWDNIKKEEGDQKSSMKKSQVPLKWKGTWVPCEDCADAKNAPAPKRNGGALDVESVNHFEVSGYAKPIDNEDSKKDDKRQDENATTAIPHEATLIDGDGWDMEDGDDKKKYKDEVHLVRLSNIKWMGNVKDQRDNLVFAKGTNEFGPFISAGWMKPGCRLTLARRYLGENDARVKWTLNDLKENVMSGIFDKDSGRVNIPPWQCDAMHSNVQQPGKRKNAN